MMSFISFLISLGLASLSLAASLPLEAKIGNSPEENLKQYGPELQIEPFSAPDKAFTGYIHYEYSKDWKIVAFYKKAKVRSEHLIAKNEGSCKTMTREEVRDIANTMFDPSQRGAYQREMIQAKVDGHFFNRGLVAYEKLLDGRKVKGYNGIKVLLYDGDASFASVNPRALI